MTNIYKFVPIAFKHLILKILEIISHGYMQIAHGHSSPGGDNILYDVWLHYSGQIKEEEITTNFIELGLLLFGSIITFLWLESAFDIYLMVRQLMKYNEEEEMSDVYVDIMTPLVFEKARLYGIDRTKFRICKTLYLTTMCTLGLIFGWTAALWRVAQDCADKLPFGSSDSEILVTVIFVLINNLISTLTELPLSFYDIFVIESQHGFNKQSVEMFLNDQLNYFTMVQLFFLPLSALSVMIIKLGGERFFVWLWMFICILCMFINMSYPTLMSDFDMKCTPLPEGKLKRDFEELAQIVDFPHENVFVFNGSMRSRHTNAYFAGIFDSKRIVLYDTLLAKKAASSTTGLTIGCSDDEVLAIICHEFGHWKLNHVMFRMLFVQANLFLTLAMYSQLKDSMPLFYAFGFKNDQKPVLVGLISVMDFIMAPYNALAMIALLFIGREMEFQADDYAKNLGYGEPLKRALIKLHKDNLNSPIHDWMHFMFNESHPSLLDRLARIEENL
ncbi:CAAX prenyl protease 1 homolog [Ctenocephalides felis]|uniref:CAAX prenyl protease 1 homolog n=1 Tax=Ctenocephalides felis TaxID=7515 RepID=UPI000E6E5481|nr:CAAX prenyl protease 1 homolog [Ctenocephalides felis]